MKASDLRMDDVQARLVKTQAEIAEREEDQEILRKKMTELLVLIRKTDREPLLFVFIRSANIFDAFNAIEQYLQITSQLNGVITRVRQVEAELVAQKEVLVEEEEEAQNLLSIQLLQREELNNNTQSQKTLLKQTQGKEKIYQTQLSDRKAQAAEIRTRIYQLLETGKNRITFGEAVQMAKGVSQITGIDPAFLLAVLTQESNLGANVGTCNRPTDPPSKSWKVIMKPTRDQEPFVEIMKNLGRSPDGTPVSCPMRDKKGNQIGWGGAMGPAQFIPSTWIGYVDKIKKLTGHTPDPWDIRDAFLAAGLKLVAGGADGTQQGNWNAAMRYFSGSTNVRFRFYGDQVLARAADYQDDIDALK
ncbi:MAG: hypothetical protein AAB431_04280, partial [Patescibacteria group bacterium]